VENERDDGRDGEGFASRSERSGAERSGASEGVRRMAYGRSLVNEVLRVRCERARWFGVVR